MLLVLGINKEKLHDTLLPVCEEVMRLFYYMKIGKLLAEAEKMGMQGEVEKSQGVRLKTH